MRVIDDGLADIIEINELLITHVLYSKLFIYRLGVLVFKRNMSLKRFEM